jgi:predicted CXXCH cytochrome family protein
LTRKRRKSATEGGSRNESTNAADILPTRDTSPGRAEGGLLSRRKVWIAASIVAFMAAGAGLGLYLLNDSPMGWTAHDAPVATFVGSETCAGCHQTEAEHWRSSQHKVAMGYATDKLVLGDFNDVAFDYYGVRSRFFRKDSKFFVETDGSDGKLATFEVKYTFGVDPLQQYLIEFPDGRLQALSIAWDTRSKDQGGQRWFHLYPNENIQHDDVLHWTKLNQNWNFMCAECHSTGVRKNYDETNDRFGSTWAEISVGCEACHGQGSAHVAWIRKQQSSWPFGKVDDPSKGLLVSFDERRDIVWRLDSKTGNPQRNFTPPLVRKEVETCGLCHARRAEFSEDWVPGRWLSDTHVVTPLVHGLYSVDGQMQDQEEVYNYGPFKQSKMFAAGVTCSDCHDPHSAKLRLSGDSVCLQCHTSDKYAVATHNHHEGVSPAVACASCHMPTHSYMVIDRRHDHSFRIPRPDVSAKLGTSNACNDCHKDKSPEWAAAAVESWFGPDREGYQKYADAFHASWTELTDAETRLAAVAADSSTPVFARASALTELASYVSPTNINLAGTGLADPDPMVRIGALDMLENLPPAQIWHWISPLLTDSSRGVRIKAVDLLAAVPTASQPAADRAHFDEAATEFVAAQRLNADRPESRSALGRFYARLGLSNDAENEYKAALRLNPQFAPAAINLADLYRQLGRDSDGAQALSTALLASPRDADLHHALGLVLVRAKRLNDALGELRQAAELNPNQARYDYVYAVALNSAGRPNEAIAALKENLSRHPNHHDTLMALVAFNRDAGDLDSALKYAEQLARITPTDRDLDSLINELRQKINKPGQQ